MISQQSFVEKIRDTQSVGELSKLTLEAITESSSNKRSELPGAVTYSLETCSNFREDEDIQLTLFLLYSSSYGMFPDLDAGLEWDASLIAARRLLENRFEQQLRQEITLGALPEPQSGKVAETLFEMTADQGGASLPKYISKRATERQAREYVVQKSIYTLREADPHSWAIPRLTGRAKAALLEIQFDEYGSGKPDRIHAQIFANTMDGLGLNSSYGAYLAEVPAQTLASMNVMSLFGLNRRLLGCVIGHLAAFEMTSSIPNRHLANGFRRLGFGNSVTDYFDEHVEADAVHEQIAARDLAGSLAEDRPDLLSDILFGAMACLELDGAMNTHILESWSAGKSSLRKAAQNVL